MIYIIYNISVIIIFIGVLLLLYTTFKHYNKCPVLQNDEFEQENPSKLYNKMFKTADIWMGYADFDTKKYKSKLF